MIRVIEFDALEVCLERCFLIFPGAGDERKNPFPARRHLFLQFAVSENRIAFERHSAHLDFFPFLNRILQDELVFGGGIRIRHETERNRGVLIALLVIELADIGYIFLDFLRIKFLISDFGNVCRGKRKNVFDAVIFEMLVAFKFDSADDRAFLDDKHHAHACVVGLNVHIYGRK